MRIRARLVVALLLLGCNESHPEPAPIPKEAVPPPSEAYKEAKAQEKRRVHEAVEKLNAEKREKAKTFEAQLAKIDKKIKGAVGIATKNPGTFLAAAQAAQAYMSRARLTGDYDDYAKADEWVDKAFQTHPSGFGPYFVRASLNFTLHRLDRIDADLEKHLKELGKNNARKAADLAFTAKVAAQRGQYKEAHKLFDGALAIERNYTTLTAAAVYTWKTGRFDEAETLFGEALDGYRGSDMESIAWVHLMLGLMDLDRGRFDDALAHYETAASFIKGYWLIDEHIAEILTLQGKTEEAKTLYLDIIERTSSPEFMDAMAGILFEAGEDDKAREYVARADARYQEQLAAFPEAAYGHALDHFLEFGEDKAHTLKLAQKNHDLRPNAEAKAKLAQAQVAAGDKAAAKKTMKAAVATPFSTADFHLTAAEVFGAVGDAKASAAQLARAKAINPKAELPPAEG